MTDQPMSGAQFRRHVGVDPERWAEQFLLAYAQADAVRTDADRQAFVAGWFRSAMEEAARSADLRVLASLPMLTRDVEPLKPMENTMLREVSAGLCMALAAQERGDDQYVRECLKHEIKRLNATTDATDV